MNNKDLNKAKVNCKDDFYTTLHDIEAELQYYNPSDFKDQIVYMNCDNPKKSNFWRFFHEHFSELQLKKIIATCKDEEDPQPFKFEYSGGNDLVLDCFEKTELFGDDLFEPGDFMSPECVEILKESDIVITNPPFSKFTDFIVGVTACHKKFIVIGNLNAVKYSVMLPQIMDNKIRVGASIHSGDRKFYVPDSYPLDAANCGYDELGNRFVNVKGVRWFTNLEHSGTNEFLVTGFSYYDNPEFYKIYDNYGYLNVDKTSQIPDDYYGIMGVPISFIDRYNPEQFQILGSTSKGLRMGDNWVKASGGALINGEQVYERLFIKRKS